MPGDWDESKHPRGEAGKFGAGSGGQSAGRSPRASAVAKAAVSAKRGGKKDVERGYQHIVAGDYAASPADKHREFAKAMDAFARAGHEPNAMAKSVMAKHGFDPGTRQAKPTPTTRSPAVPTAPTRPPETRAQRAPQAAAMSPGDGMNWQRKTHYVAGRDGRGQPIQVEHEHPTHMADVEHGRYVISSDPAMGHSAVYYPKDRGGENGGDVLFIDRTGRPNHPSMGIHQSESDARAAVARHHAAMRRR